MQALPSEREDVCVEDGQEEETDASASEVPAEAVITDVSR